MFKLEKIKSKDVKRVCMAHTVYTLLQYLLISSEEELQQTFFFLSTDFSPHLLDRLPNKYVCYPHKAPFLLRPFHNLLKLFRQCTNKITYPFLKHAEIYALDHASLFFPYLRGYQYIQLEDGFGTYSPPNSTIATARLFGFPLEKQWGRSKNCRYRLLSRDPAPDSYLCRKPYCKFDLQKLWSESSAQKKQYILDLFDISKEDLAIFDRCENILLTQCFSEDYMITEQEKLACYHAIIEAHQLSPQMTLIKTHPRETTDYESNFPGFTVYRKKVPLELMALNCIRIKKAVTVSSTSVFILKRSGAEIIWCGSKFSPALEEKYGKLGIPFGCN